MLTTITLIYIYIIYLSCIKFSFISVAYNTYKGNIGRFILDYLLEHKYETLIFGSKRELETTKGYLIYEKIVEFMAKPMKTQEINLKNKIKKWEVFILNTGHILIKTRKKTLFHTNISLLNIVNI